ncbi:hypothetical protein V22_42870 [Calycomorphotria hydatis]|uniref:Uncharacterized protein n=1 Tax=Calycomorphotria hydatis TaxID=2528027 RepID=A0A517TF67_9PLAN|nr:hypothetical protein V22_42870 [Calycomorphotria hydatis]
MNIAAPFTNSPDLTDLSLESTLLEEHNFLNDHRLGSAEPVAAECRDCQQSNICQPVQFSAETTTLLKHPGSRDLSCKRQATSTITRHSLCIENSTRGIPSSQSRSLRNFAPHPYRHQETHPATLTGFHWEPVSLRERSSDLPNRSSHLATPLHFPGESLVSCVGCGPQRTHDEKRNVGQRPPAGGMPHRHP